MLLGRAHQSASSAFGKKPLGEALLAVPRVTDRAPGRVRALTLIREKSHTAPIIGNRGDQRMARRMRSLA